MHHAGVVLWGAGRVMTAPALDKGAEAEVRSAAAERDPVAASIDRVYAQVREGITAIGGMEIAAAACGLDRGDLRRALDHNGRYLAVDHVLALGARFRRYNATVTTKLGAALVLPLDLLVFPLVSMSPEERANRLERYLRRQQFGDQHVAAALDLLAFPRVPLSAEQRADKLEGYILRLPFGDQQLAAALEAA